MASERNCEQQHTSVLNLIFQQANVAGLVDFQNENPKSAVVVLHQILRKIFPHQSRMNFWLTVLTGISNPKLCLVFWLSLISCGDVRSETLETQGLDPCG